MADAQAGLSLRWMHSHFVGFVKLWLRLFTFMHVSELLSNNSLFVGQL